MPLEDTAKTANAKNRNPMSGLYDRLRKFGLSTKYVRKMLLPDWWDDDAAMNPAGFTEAVWTIARHLGVPAEQLRDPTQAIVLPRQYGVQFKLNKGTDKDAVDLARILGEQVAKYALLGVPRSDVPLENAQDIRTGILEAGAPWVGFGTLLDYCWSIGIPVLHLSELPGRKMDGMAISIDGRPAIVLSTAKAASWLLFHLAHELGHVALGHVANGTVVDDDIETDATEPLEAAANAFALELITGKAGTRMLPKVRWMRADSLARLAQQYSALNSVDPGHFVLNYADSMSRGGKGKFWGVATEALKLLPSEGDAATMIRERMAKNLDWPSLPTEAAEFVARMTGQP